VEEDFAHIIESSGEQDQYSEGGRLWPLSTLTSDRECLQVGGSLLPLLVEFYQWLHADLAHVLSYKQASELTIGHVMKLVEGNLDKKEGSHARSLYKEVKEGYNRFVELMGSRAHGCTISDDIPILHLLTGIT
jgi:hypothetical protein